MQITTLTGHFCCVFSVKYSSEALGSLPILKQSDVEDVMLLKEYRICLPLTVQEVGL